MLCHHNGGIEDKEQLKTKTPPGAVLLRLIKPDLSGLIVIGVCLVGDFPDAKRIRDRFGTVKHAFFNAKGRQ